SPRLRFFATAPATSAIYPLSLHDALPISPREALSVLTPGGHPHPRPRVRPLSAKDFHIQGYAHDEQARRLPEYDWAALWGYGKRSEEHTSELQSRENLVCRLLLEKKKATA